MRCCTGPRCAGAVGHPAPPQWPAFDNPHHPYYIITSLLPATSLLLLLAGELFNLSVGDIKMLMQGGEPAMLSQRGLQCWCVVLYPVLVGSGAKLAEAPEFYYIVSIWYPGCAHLPCHSSGNWYEQHGNVPVLLLSGKWAPSTRVLVAMVCTSTSCCTSW